MGAMTSLVIVDSDSVRHTVPAGSSLTVKGGYGFSSLVDDSGALHLNCDGAPCANDPDLLALFQALTVEAPYISSVNNAYPFSDGTFFINGGPCVQVGVFDGQADRVSPLGGPAHLYITDVCAPCIDCDDWARICVLADKLGVALQGNVNVNIKETDSNAMLLYRQYQAFLYLWNYLMHKQSLVFDLKLNSPSRMTVTVGYFCPACGPLGDISVDMTLSMAGQDYVYMEEVSRLKSSNPGDTAVTTTISYDKAHPTRVDTAGAVFKIIPLKRTQPLGFVNGDYFKMVFDLSFYRTLPQGVSGNNATVNTWTLSTEWRNTHMGELQTDTAVVTSGALPVQGV